jgi:hypothetical protein
MCKATRTHDQLLHACCSWAFLLSLQTPVGSTSHVAYGKVSFGGMHFAVGTGSGTYLQAQPQRGKPNNAC